MFVKKKIQTIDLKTIFAYLGSWTYVDVRIAQKTDVGLQFKRKSITHGFLESSLRVL